MPQTQIDLREFSERVERLCEFILDQADLAGAPESEISLIHKLKEDAADIQNNRRLFGISLLGLDNHMRGIFKPT